MFLKARNKWSLFGFSPLEMFIISLKYIFLQKSLITSLIKSFLRKILCGISNYLYYSKFKSSCVFTSRCGSVYRFFRVSRIFLRASAGNNLLYGVRKSSW